MAPLPGGAREDLAMTPARSAASIAAPLAGLGGVELARYLTTKAGG